ncbi:siroheme synthase CysG [Elstera cyanobacteriorum]|uniref:siroheme synthase CysG n=1 Tax=Elstera cyanobacteriorum TaxID=2022747 RepID=UPI002352C641|nr:siroheme synthase CysG [Elstera cyanobacteriorum]MCK6441419.1 siroheme synthase CysG [Elstera cyanobacteriorum]
MHSLPIFLSLNQREALIVGGGEAATQKLRLLKRTGARITVIAKNPSAEIEAAAVTDEILLLRRAFRLDDIRNQAVIFAATGDEAEDAEISRRAQDVGVPVNIVDGPDLSSFLMPAIVDRDPVLVAIGTGGAAPILARRLREQFERLLPARLGLLARFLDKWKHPIRGRVSDPATRRRVMEQLSDGPIADLVLAGDDTAADVAATRLLAGGAVDGGSVALVGAGPGDPELLTLKALRALSDADIVFYDELVAPAILDRIRRDAERVPVGKRRAQHSVPQAEIAERLIAAARAGKRVVRLKGGDPFVFGRGGEEVQAVRAAGIALTIVPGISAALGCAASAEIPLTHRDHASALVLATGHGQDGTPFSNAGVPAPGHKTIAIYMGLAQAPRLTDALIAAGHATDTPVALIENGTRPDQKITTGRLADLPRLALHHTAGPTLLIVGETVRLSRYWGETDAPAETPSALAAE